MSGDVLKVPAGVFEDAQGAFSRMSGNYDALGSQLKGLTSGLGDALGDDKVASQFRDAFNQLGDGLSAAGQACGSMARDVLERLKQDFEHIDQSQRIRTERTNGRG